MLKRVSLVVLSFLTVFSLTSPVFGAAAPAEQVLNLGGGSEPKDLDPHLVTGVPENKILVNMFEGLVNRDAENKKEVPGVAESWKISKDGKTYTFKLRKDAKWSNGDPVTAQDFVYGFIRCLLPATASEYAFQLHYLKNGKAFNEGKITDASQVGVKAIDAQTLELSLENPTPYFLSLLDKYPMYPIHKATIDKHGTKWTRPGNLVSNGPYMLDKWDIHKVISLKQNPNYWDKKNLNITTVNFYPMDVATEEKMFRTGALHVTYELPLEKVPYWQADKTKVYRQDPFMGVYYYWANVTKPPMNNLNLRKALALGFDREKIVKYVTKGGQTPGTSLVAPGIGSYKEVATKYPKDLSQLAKAKECLEKAKKELGGTIPPVELTYNTNESHKKIAEALQAMWKTNLGLDIKLINQEWKVYLDNMKTKNYQMARAGWIGDYADPNAFLEQFLSNNLRNYSGWSNKKYDELLDKAAKEQNVGKRNKLLQEAEAIGLEELPVIPIYNYTHTYLISPKLEGWKGNVMNYNPVKYMKLKP